MIEELNHKALDPLLILSQCSIGEGIGPRPTLPAVLGTLISQTLLNLLALAILGVAMFSTIGLFAGRQQALLLYAAAPFLVLCAVLVAPALIRSGGSIPVVAEFAKRRIPTIVSGFGLPDDAFHAPDESFRLESLDLGERTARELLTALAEL